MKNGLRKLLRIIDQLRDPPSLNSLTLDKDDVRIARRMKRDSTDDDFVREYEREFSRWNGSESSFAFMSGREALTACIEAIGLEAGDKVIIPGYTCVVVPNAFEYRDITIEYADIELDTFGISAESLEQTISDQTDAVLLQHLYGLVSRDYEEIIKLAEEHGATVIEDCAHSTGAEYRGTKVGNRGDVAFYSSEKSKIFTTIQGGMATTNRADIAENLDAYYRDSPRPDTDLIRAQLDNIPLKYYRHKSPYRRILGIAAMIHYRGRGITSTTQQEMNGEKPENYGRKMPGSIAAIGTNQLQKIDHYNQQRQKNADRWESWATKKGYDTPTVLNNSTPVFLRYPLLVPPEKKSDLTWAKKELGFKPGVWFTGKHHPIDINLPDCPNANRAVAQCINLPCLFPHDRHND